MNIEAPSVPRRERAPRAEPKASSAVPPSATPPTADELMETFEEDVDRSMVELGLEVAAKAKAISKVITIHPMQAAHRRLIHQTVLRYPGVRTVSEGEGLYRRMHVVPDGLAGASPSSRGKKGRRRRGRGGRKPGSPQASL
ncbi:MAG: hypothetical protein HC923_07910 [Myxococcales bacterium]|nr:hypothetical protein [Myxococcales bacterium]